MAKTKAANEKPSKEQIENAKEALELLFASQYIDKKRLYSENFIRGIMFGAGTIIGSAIVLTLLLWVLSLLDSAPFIGPIFENIESSVEQTRR